VCLIMNYDFHITFPLFDLSWRAKCISHDILDGQHCSRLRLCVKSAPQSNCQATSRSRRQAREKESGEPLRYLGYPYCLALTCSRLGPLSFCLNSFLFFVPPIESLKAPPALTAALLFCRRHHHRNRLLKTWICSIYGPCRCWM